MRHLKVDDVMTRRVATVQVGAPFKEVARLLAERKISAVPVLDGDGKLAGIVSEADLLRKEQYHEDAMPTRRRFGSRRERVFRAKARGDFAGDVMTTPAITVGPEASVVEAAKVMIERNVKRLPVVDFDGCLVGIVSRADLLWVFLRPDDEIAEEIRTEVFARVLLQEPTYTVTVNNGIVMLSGRLDRRSAVEIAERLVRAVDGVVDVVNGLTYRVDDSGPSPHEHVGRIEASGGHARR
jgi:CBS domain-containing protein